MFSQSLSGKVCIITGGVGLLGAAFVKACAAEGAIVAVLDIDEKKGSRIVASIQKKIKSAQICYYSCNINNRAEINAVLKMIIKKYKRIDALVNNAYPHNQQYGRKFEAVTYQDFCENMGLHVGGYFLISQQVAAIMKRQRSGTIVNMGSIYGFSAPRFSIYAGTDMTTPVEYAAIKGAVLNLTTYLASYLGKYNIRVNAISPGGVYNNQPSSFVKKYSERVLLGSRMATPNDLIGALVFLLSDAAGYITGQNVVVDGGWTL